MRTPLCEFCLQTAELCGGCSSKLQKGALTQLEVDISRFLANHEKEFALQELEFTRAIDCGNIVFIFTKTGPGLLIGKGGRTISRLIKQLGKHVRVVRESTDLHALAEEILHPIKLVHVNKIFHEGKEKTKILIPRKLFPKLPARAQDLEKLIEKITGKSVQISAE